MVNRQQVRCHIEAALTFGLDSVHSKQGKSLSRGEMEDMEGPGGQELTDLLIFAQQDVWRCTFHVRCLHRASVLYSSAESVNKKASMFQLGFSCQFCWWTHASQSFCDGLVETHRNQWYNINQIVRIYIYMIICHISERAHGFGYSTCLHISSLNECLVTAQQQILLFQWASWNPGFGPDGHVEARPLADVLPRSVSRQQKKIEFKAFLIIFESYHSDFSHWLNAGSFGLSGCLWDRNIIAMDGIDKRSHWTLLKCGERIVQ